MSALFILAVMIPNPAAGGFSETIHVPGDPPTIQEAIDTASFSCTIVVTPNICFIKIDFKGEAITVKSAGGAAMTVVDGGKRLFLDRGWVVTF